MAARLPVLGPQGLIFRPRDRYFPRRLLCFPPPRPPMLRLWSAEYRTFEGEATAYRMCRDFLVTDCCADTTFPVSVGADLSHFVKRHAYVVINHPNSEHSPAACDMPFHTMCQFGRDAFHCNSAGDVLQSPTQVDDQLIFDVYSGSSGYIPHVRDTSKSCYRRDLVPRFGWSTSTGPICLLIVFGIGCTPRDRLLLQSNLDTVPSSAPILYPRND